jgi:hypothetical protein
VFLALLPRKDLNPPDLVIALRNANSLYGVWVSYPSMAPMHSQQRWGDPASQVLRTSVFS